MKKIITIFAFMVLYSALYAQQRPAVSGNRPPQVISEGYFNRQPPEIQKIIKDNPQRFIIEWGVMTGTNTVSTSSQRTVDQNNTITVNPENTGTRQRFTQAQMQAMSAERRANIIANPDLYEIID